MGILPPREWEVSQYTATSSKLAAARVMTSSGLETTSSCSIPLMMHQQVQCLFYYCNIINE